MEDQQMTVKISGRSIYTAVKDYIINNPALKQGIESKIKEVLDSDAIREMIERSVKASISNHWLKTEIKDHVNKFASAALSKEFNGQIVNAIREKIDKSVIVVSGEKCD